MLLPTKVLMLYAIKIMIKPTAAFCMVSLACSILLESPSALINRNPPVTMRPTKSVPKTARIMLSISVARMRGSIGLSAVLVVVNPAPIPPAWSCLSAPIPSKSIWANTRDGKITAKRAAE